MTNNEDNMTNATEKLIALAAELEEKYISPAERKQEEKFKTLDRKCTDIIELTEKIKQNYAFALKEEGSVSKVMRKLYDVNFASANRGLDIVINELKGVAHGLEKSSIPWVGDL